MQHCAKSTAVFETTLVKLLLFLSEKSGESIFFSKLAHMLGSELKESLKLATSDFTHSINLFDKLLKQSTNVSLKELSLICSKASQY